MWDVLCSVRALISAFSALCLPGKQELEALYRFTAGNGITEQAALQKPTLEEISFCAPTSELIFIVSSLW